MTSDSIEDFKAAFVCITSSPKGYFKSPEDLTRALQGCGKNPSPKKIDSYWRRYNRIDMDTFCEIAQDENTITERELLEAFSYIDINKNGYISTKDFITLFTTSEDSISELEARDLVEEADLNNDGRINYREFSRFIIETIEKAKRVARKKMKKIITEKEMEKEIIRRSPSLKSESKYIDDYDNKSLKKSRTHHYDSDMDRESSRRPSSANLKRMLKNEVKLARENSNDSFGSTSKMKHHSRNEHDYYDEERPKRRSSEREFENEREFERHRERDRDSERERRNNYHDNDLNRKRDLNYDEDRMSRHSDRREHSREHSRERSRDRNRDDRYLENDERPHRSRSREKERDYRDRNKEFDLDNERHHHHNSEKRKSPRSSKHSLFETKHKPLDRVVENFQEPKHLKRWTNKSTKGAFYFNENINSIISNSFALDIQTETSVFFTIETFQTNLHTSNLIREL